MANDLRPAAWTHAICGVYLITPDWTDTERLLRGSEAALSAGVRTLQYRNKTASPEVRGTQAQALRALTRRHGAALIVNDDPELALEIDADGLHVGRDDAAARTARARLPARMLLGVSCYDDFEAALRARGDGADYVAFGSVFSSPTKPTAVRAPLQLFARARSAGLHAVAIGGIDETNIAAVAQAGARAAALITAIYAAADPRRAAQILIEQFDFGTQGKTWHEPQRTTL